MENEKRNLFVDLIGAESWNDAIEIIKNDIAFEINEAKCNLSMLKINSKEYDDLNNKILLKEAYLTSENYVLGKVLDIFRYNVALILGVPGSYSLDENIHNSKKSSIVDSLIDMYGEVLGTKEELLNLSFEDLRKKLYDYVGVEYISLDEFKKQENTTKDFLIKSGIEKTSSGYCAVCDVYPTNDMEYIVGIGLNNIYSPMLIHL